MIEPFCEDLAEAETMAKEAVKHFPALKACPFCGCEAWLYSSPRAFAGHCAGGSLGHRVECEGDCHAMTCYWHTKEEAISNWNRRVI